MRWTLAGLLIAAAAGSVACLNIDGPTGPRTSAVVTGQVTKPDGVTPVSGAGVLIQLLSAATGNTAQVLGTSPVTTANDGRFLILFLMRDSVQTGSAIIHVSPPLAQGLVDFDTTGIPVKIMLGESPAESTYVQMALKAR